MRRCFINSIPILIAFLAGALLPLAFAPLNFYLLALICPAIFLVLLNDIKPWQGFWRGFCFGLGFFGVGVSWIFISIHEYGNANIFLAGLFTGIFVAGMALFPAIQGYLSAFFSKGIVKNLLAFPCIWLLLEWVRSWILSGFPWNYLAFSQVDSPLSGYIPILGEYGTGFLLLFSSGLLVSFLQLWWEQNISYRDGIIIIGLLLIWIIGPVLSQIHWTQPYERPIKVALVQGNIPQDLKWQPSHVQSTIDIYYQFTSQLWDNPIIVWPEAAIPLPLPQAQPVIQELSELARSHHVALLIGIPVQAPNQFYYYNALIALGNGYGNYYKRHLVPFGEYVPFENQLRGLMQFFNLPMSTMLNGARQQNNLMAVGIQIAPFICYEIAYAEDLLQSLPQAKILLTVSNDAWFGNSLAPSQHLQIGQFRALQSGRELLFSANSGISAIVDARGQIKNRIPQFKRAVLKGVVQPMQGSTPWSLIGNNLIVAIIFLLFLIAIILGSAPKVFNVAKKQGIEDKKGKI